MGRAIDLLITYRVVKMLATPFKKHDAFKHGIIDEKGNVKKVLIYPKKSNGMNLAFDVTPAKYVTGLITEKGVCEASEKGLKDLFK